MDGITNFSYMSDSDLILAVDLGTSETKAVLVGLSGLIDSSIINYVNSLEYPQTGWVEQDANVLADAIFESIKKLVQNNQDKLPKIKGLIYTGQMGGVLPLDINGKPLSKMITWMDTRAAELAKSEMIKGWPKVMGYPLFMLLKFVKITGGIFSKDGKNTICHAFWLKHVRPDIYEKSHKLLDLKDYAVFLSTGKYVTSTDEAYITWLMDTREDKMCYAPELFNMFGLTIDKFPEIKQTTDIVGKVSEEFSKKTGLPSGISVVNGAGDLLSAAIGSSAIDYGKIHASIGTAGWVGTHFGKKTIDIKHYAGTIASGMPGKFLIICKQETMGGALEWFKNILYFNDKRTSKEIFEEINGLVKNSPPGARNLIFCPWLIGERSLINDAFVRGNFINLSIENTRGDMLRAVYEGVSYSIRFGCEVAENLSKLYQDEIIVIGGASKSDIWCQIIADVLQKKVLKTNNSLMATGIGSATIAMVGLGIIKDFSHVKKINKIKKEFLPNPANKMVYDKIYSQFRKVYKNNKSLFEALNRNKLKK